MATTKLSQEVLDLNPGNPDYILDSTNAVTVINAGGNQYNFNGVYGKFGAKIGTITLTGVPAGHPIAFINNGKTSQISYTGTVDEGTATGPDGNTYTFYSGTVTLTVSADFGTISYYCKIHGYMGGQDNLVYTYSDSGLKIPSGTEVNRPTAVAGMVRNNTNETSEGSASCEEYYNGAAWQKLNNVAIPPPVGFNALIWSGNGTTQSLTGIGFQPDLVWIKNRNGTNPHGLWDSTRGAGKLLKSSASEAETGNSGDLMGSFDSDGFQVNRNYLSFTAYDNTNWGAGTYVGWTWKANSGTTSSNTDGSITSTVQANQETGFSIVQWSGTGAVNTVGHGLSAAPQLILIKSLSQAGDWQVYAEPIGNGNKLVLNATGGSSSTTRFDSTSPTSSVFTLNDSGLGTGLIAYCFHSISGYSKIGSYTGNGNTGQSITGLGFSPNFLLIKITDATDNWVILDSIRGGTNILAPNSNAQEFSESGVNITFDSDGFSLSGTGGGQGQVNGNGNSYIYMAFKAG
tara:strand:+ start:354 stop:1898 length:1545 start_codon:yes stop_codon:yes gene_type:complete